MIHKLKGEGWTYAQLCREFSISSTQLGRILSGQQWQEIWREVNGLEEANRRMQEMPEPTEEEMQDLFGDLLAKAEKK